MERYIALLRGINVGGDNKISMSRLKEAFKEHGFEDVITYINSGNLIFSSRNSLENEITLKKQCEEILLHTFKLAIPVAIFSVVDFSDALHHAPLWWDSDKNSKHNAIFVIPPTTTQDIIEQGGLTPSEYEQVGCYGQVIFWSAPLKTFSRTRLSKFVSKNGYGNITIRNANTTKKLLQLVVE